MRLHEPDGYECRSAASSGHLLKLVFRTDGGSRSSKIPGSRSATSDAGARHDRTDARVRVGGDSEPVTASTPKQREVPLEQVKAHVTTELASCRSVRILQIKPRPLVCCAQSRADTMGLFPPLAG